MAAGELTTASFRRYARQVVKNAQTLAAELKKGGLDIVSGGTDKHLVLVDLRNLKLSGWTVAWALDKAGIIANRNTVPYDTASPYYPSGLRLGTPALTSRGMKVPEMKKIAVWILAVIDHVKKEKMPEGKKAVNRFAKKFRQAVDRDPWLKKLNREVTAFAKKYPLPGI